MQTITRSIVLLLAFALSACCVNQQSDEALAAAAAGMAREFEAVSGAFVTTLDGLLANNQDNPDLVADLTDLRASVVEHQGTFDGLTRLVMTEIEARSFDAETQAKLLEVLAKVLGE